MMSGPPDSTGSVARDVCSEEGTSSNDEYCDLNSNARCSKCKYGYYWWWGHTYCCYANEPFDKECKCEYNSGSELSVAVSQPSREETKVGDGDFYKIFRYGCALSGNWWAVGKTDILECANKCKACRGGRECRGKTCRTFSLLDGECELSTSTMYETDCTWSAPAAVYGLIERIFYR